MSTTTTTVSTATQQETQAVLTPATPARESCRSASVGATPSPAIAPPETRQSSRAWARDRSEATRLNSDIDRILPASNIRALRPHFYHLSNFMATFVPPVLPAGHWAAPPGLPAGNPPLALAGVSILYRKFVTMSSGNVFLYNGIPDVDKVNKWGAAHACSRIGSSHVNYTRPRSRDTEAHEITVSEDDAVPVEPLNNAAERLRVLERDRRHIEDEMAILRSGGIETDDGTRTESGRSSFIGDKLLPQEMKAACMRRHKNMFSVLPKYDGAANVSKLHEFTELHGKYLIAIRMFSNEEVREHLPFYLTKLAGQWFRRLEQQGS
ncbi:hypothetical protein BDZ88DRAFT_442303 [Geranomyces variabilis]|nr:hypothetical protein BDZ88DRAFT_442303 [Geranomyces variabilis]